MNPNIEYSIRRIRPHGNRFGRRPGRRDKLVGIAFGAALLFGLWWMLLRPVSYSVVSVDVYDSFGWTDRTVESTRTEFRGFRAGNPVTVFVGPYSSFEVMRELAAREQATMLLDYAPYPDAKRDEFANAIVVCAEPGDCPEVKNRIVDAAKRREAERKRR